MNRFKNITFAALLLALSVSLAGCGEETQAEAEIVPAKELPRVQVAVVEPVSMRDVLTLPGETEADKDVTLSSEVAGRVEWIGPEEGDRVRKGQTVIKIDVTALGAKSDKAEAALRLAKDQAERKKKLFDRGVVSRDEFDQALTTMDEARATAAEARVNYGKGIVRVPVTAVVDELHVDPGEYVSAGDKLVELVNRDVVRVNVDMPELDVRYLKRGDEVRVIVDAWAGRSWTGKIDFIASKADSATRTFKTRILVDNADGAIRPGMLARVSFERRIVADAVSVPLSALRDKGGERVIYVEKDGVAHSRTVSIGIIEGDSVQILNGLEAGENLIIAGQDGVAEGVKVEVR